MKTRTTLLLLGVLGVLAVLAALSRGPGPGEQGAPGEAVFPGLEAAAVRAVRVARPEGAVQLERGGEGWTVVPAGHPADGPAIERLLGQLAGLAGGSVVSTNPAKRAAFGLEEGRRIDVRLEGVGGGLIAAFSVGAGGPDFASSNIAREGDDRVLLVPIDLRVPLGRDAEGWRDRRVVGLAREEISAVSIARAGSAVRLEREGDGGSWTVDGGPADAVAIGRYLDQLAALRVAAFEDFGAAGSPGLDTPAGTVEVEARGRSVTLAVGAQQGDAGRRFLRSSRFEEPVLVSAPAADALLRSAADFAPPPPAEQPTAPAR